MKDHRLRTRILTLLVALASVFYWFKTPPPKVGGGRSDDPLARLVKTRVYATIPADDEKGFSRLTPENANSWYNVSREPIQSFDYYQRQGPPRPTPARRTIVLQPIGPFGAIQTELLNDLKEFCTAFFQLPVRIATPLPLPLPGAGVRIKDATWQGQNFRRKRYQAEDLIGKIIKPRLPTDATASLGVTMSPLYVGEGTYVFGVGSIDGRVGVYTIGRFFPDHKQSFTAAQRKRGLRRSCLTLCHEMGHMLGLYHCVLYKCAMNGANGVADADITPLDLCPVCHRKLLWNVGADGAKRYGDLMVFYQKNGLQQEFDWTKTRRENWRKVEARESG